MQQNPRLTIYFEAWPIRRVPAAQGFPRNQVPAHYRRTDGVERTHDARALQIYRDEIHRNMAILGCNTIADIGPQCLLFADDHQLRPPQEKPALRVVEGKAAES